MLPVAALLLPDAAMIISLRFDIYALFATLMAFFFFFFFAL